jgi:hypothetical protein
MSPQIYFLPQQISPKNHRLTFSEINSIHSASIPKYSANRLQPVHYSMSTYGEVL